MKEMQCFCLQLTLHVGCSSSSACWQEQPHFLSSRLQSIVLREDMSVVCKTSSEFAGTVTLPSGTEMVMPGDNVTAEFELIAPVAMESGLRFALREGGRTVGAGVVSEVVA